MIFIGDKPRESLLKIRSREEKMGSRQHREEAYDLRRTALPVVAQPPIAHVLPVGWRRRGRPRFHLTVDGDVAADGDLLEPLDEGPR